MSFGAGKLRVLIATTNGPVEVQLLTEEDAAIGRCVACIGGTTETADIASAYHAFVVRPTGVIEARFGHSCYRLDVSGRIDAGSSWQLGVLAAHALLAAGRLAQENDVADGVLWATGSVRPVDLTVGAVSHVPEKLANALDRLREERRAGRSVLLALPAANADDVPPEVAKQLRELGIALAMVAHAQALFDALSMKLPQVATKGPAPALGAPVVTKDAAASKPPRAIRVWAAAVVLIGVVAAGALAFTRSGTWLSPSQPAGTVAPTAPPAGSKPATGAQPSAAPNAPSSLRPGAGALVPETIPFITTRDRQRIRDEYMTAPDHKAMAITMFEVAFVSGRPSQEDADKAALEACEKEKRSIPRDTALARTESRCELFASGNVTVKQRLYIAMPPMPWINASVQRPFVAAELPIVSQEAKDSAERRYHRSPGSKALVIGGNRGRYFVTTAQSSPEEAMRRTLERCGFVTRSTCLVVAVDDTFVVAIPTLARATGIYREGALFGVQPAERLEVARQLENAPQGWSAVAVGAGGHTGLKVAATSERNAVDGAMDDCARRDRDCRITVIGPFLVDATQANPAPATP